MTITAATSFVQGREFVAKFKTVVSSDSVEIATVLEGGLSRGLAGGAHKADTLLCIYVEAS